MINPVSFVVMAPLNLGLTVYPKGLRNSPFNFCIIRLRLTTTAIFYRSGRLHDA
jgi:hypothetical protein